MRYDITLGELYDKIKSYPHATMDFCITDVFSWRGIYREPCCSLSTEETTKQENLDMLRRLTNEVFRGYKGGKYTYTFDDKINFELDCSECSSGGYLKGFIKKNKELLLKDLSTRLPYGVKCDINDNKPYTLSSISNDYDGTLIRFKEQKNGFNMEVYLSEYTWCWRLDR